MASPGGKSAGRVSVRVVPDSTGFRDDLKKALQRIERVASLNVGLNLNTKDVGRQALRVREQVREQVEAAAPRVRVQPDLSRLNDRMQALQRQLQGNPLHLRLAAEADRAEKELADFRAAQGEGPLTLEVQTQIDQAQADIDKLRDRAQSEGAQLRLKADLDAALARAEIAVLARRRIVNLTVRVSKPSIAAAATALAALSGGRGALKPLQSIGTYLSNFDKHVPKIAAVSLAVAAVGAAALSSVGGLVTLGGTLVSVAGVAGVMPAALGGMVVAFGTLGLALADVDDRLGDLKGPLQRFQQDISGDYWAKAEEPIRRMVTSSLPALRTQLGQVSTALGGFTVQLAGAVGDQITGSQLPVFMTNLSRSISIAGGAMLPLLNAFTQLGAVGSTYLPDLAGWFVTLSQRFEAFIARTAADGSLKQWIDNGITALGQLGSVVASAASILSGLFDAATAAGGGGLATLASGLQNIATIVNGPTFQVALTTMFQGAAEGMAGLGAALVPIGDMFAALAPTISGVMSTAGTAIGDLLTQLAGALSQPAFQTGLTALFDGIAVGLAAIGPALPAVVGALGALAGVAGTLASTMGATLGAVFAALAPVITQVLTAVQPLIPILGAVLVQAVSALAPVIAQVAATLTQILPTLVGALLPIMVQLAPLIGQLLAAVLPLVPTIAQLVVAALSVVQALMPLIGLAISLVAALVPIVNVVVAVASALVTLLAGAIEVIVALFRGDFGRIPEIMRGALAKAIAIVDNATGGIVTRFLTFLSGLRSKTLAGFEAIRSSIASKLAAVVALVTSLPGRVLGALGNLASSMNTAGRNMVQGMINGIGSMVGALASKARELASSALNAVKGALGISSPSKVFDVEVGRQIPAGVERGIGRGQRSLDRTLTSMVRPSALPTPRAPTGPGAAAPAAGRVYQFGPTYGLTAEDVAAELDRRIRYREALEMAAV